MFDISAQSDPHMYFAEFFENGKLKTIAYQLSRSLAEGHICIDIEEHNRNLEDFRAEADEEHKACYSKINPDKIKQSPLAAISPTDIYPDKPFVLDGSRLYLQRYWVYETEIIKNVKKFIRFSEENRPVIHKSLSDNSGFLKKLSGPVKGEEPDRQLLAIITSALNRFSIITGGPGTGKTYTVTNLLALLFKLDINESVIMTAPTGKAAARMEESLLGGLARLDTEENIKEKLSSVKSQTIHSLLGYKRGTHRFRHNRDNKLRYSVIIADEASMIDAPLMSKLLEAADDMCRIVLLGDKNQLASIEAGSIFGDLCRSGSGESSSDMDFQPEAADIYKKVTGRKISVLRHNSGRLSGIVSELTKSRRFSENRGIGRFSRTVVSGEMHLVRDWNSHYGKDGLKITENQKTAQEMFDKYRKFIKEDDINTALELFDSFRILCANRFGDRGVEEINRSVERHLSINRENSLFYENRPVMIRSNDRQLDLYNGDTGIIRRNSEDRFYFHMKNRKPVPAALLPECETSFAVTIHKSQGSDYDSVLIYLPENISRILSRELLYTAVTRAKKNAVIFGSKEVVREAAGRKVLRASGIGYRLKKEAAV